MPVAAEQTTEIPAEAAEVELPVCMKCGHVGKLPGASQMTFSCTGPKEAPHKREKMRPVRYRAEALA